MKYIKITFVLTFYFMISCSDEDKNVNPKIAGENDYNEFESIEALISSFESIANSGDDERMLKLLDSLQVNNQIPFTINDSVLFIYYGEASSIQWVGDFNGWDANNSSYQGIRMGESDLWYLKKSYPKDARLDYKIVLNASNWILDPRNSYRQVSGFGPNSELRMPEWVYPEETILKDGVIRGDLSDNILISSTNLAYDIQYKIYTPYNYSDLDSLPVIYITDGHEYADQALGATITVLDNLIFEEIIEPVLAVFIDPRNPDNLSQNRRGDEYTANLNYANFVADELTAVLESNYKAQVSRNSRAIMGTSLGGWNSAFFGIKRNDKFQKLIIHSPAFDSQIFTDYQQNPPVDLDVFMSTGRINDTEDRARNMKLIMESNNYNLQYIELNEGHSWGNWRALIDEPLIFHFGK